MVIISKYQMLIEVSTLGSDIIDEVICGQGPLNNVTDLSQCLAAVVVAVCDLKVVAVIHHNVWLLPLLSCHLCRPATKNMSIDTRHPAAHVSLPLAPPTTSTAHSIQRLITPALFKRSRPLQPSLASSVHLRATPQCQQAIAASGNFYLNYTTFYCGLFLWSR